jgi:predicted ATPase
MQKGVTVFKSIEIENWKHFNRVEIEFHPRLTVITGANGSGKSTIIRILAGHFGFGLHEIGTPERDEKTGSLFYYTRKLLPVWLKKIGKTELELGEKIGKILYLGGKGSDLTIPVGQSMPQYNINIPGQQQVPGIFISAHRSPFVPSKIQQFATTPKSKSQAYSEIFNSSNNVMSGGGSSAGKTIKDTLLNWIFHGYGNTIFRANPVFKSLFEGFQQKVKEVLPASIRFDRFEPRESDIILVCESGEYSIDACSGGITALIELTWQIFTFENNNNSFVVIIDEIENHLHPSMQRSLLSSLIKAFPQAQFIVSTHSPFVVGSEKNSGVYALRFGSDSRVVSQHLELLDKASTAAEILKQVLGVPLTIPIWAEDEISQIIQKFEHEVATGENIRKLADELRSNKLDHLVAATISQFVDRKHFTK